MQTASVRRRLAALLGAGTAARVRCAELSAALVLASCASPPEAMPVVPVAPVPPVAPVAQPDEADVLTPARILRDTADTYAHCHTYRDSGRSMTKPGSAAPGPILFAPFQTAFERPDRFRFGAEVSAPLVRIGWIVWLHSPAIRSWSTHDGYEKPESLDAALAALAGVSGLSSVTVPKLLLVDAGHDSSLTGMTDVERLDDVELGSSRCFCLRGREPMCTTTVWIDQATHLLLRVVKAIDVDGRQSEVTITYDPVIDEAIPADLLAFGSPEG